MAGNESADQGTPLARERRLVEAARQQVELKPSEEEGPTTPPPDIAGDTAEPSSVGEDIAFAHVGASLLEALVAPPADDAAEKLAAEISRYEVHGPLGKGGMGEVYKARDRRLGRIVALKRIARRIEGSKGALPRLLAEARAVAALNHHNIVQVYDIDEDDDGHFITMEYVEGEDLRAKIQRDGKIDPERAIEITRQLAGALNYAHAHNIIHRDIKPSNILINTQGTPKLADFGLARMAGTATPGLTHTGAMMGTVDYASPEQLEDAKNVDHRTDIYSLGATLYEMVTGLSPRRIEESKIVEELRPCVMKTLERNPDQRFQTVDEFGESLAQVIIGDVEALMHKAEFCHRSGDLEGAAQRYERVLRTDPKHAKAQRQAALIASKIEDTRQARREATEAAREGDWKAASAAWQRVLDSAPGDLEAIQQHAKAQAQIRNEHLIAAIEQARSHLDDGDPVAARAQCRIAHEIDPENQEVAAILNAVRAAERRLRDHKMRAGAEAFKLKEYSSAVVLLTEALSLMRKNHPNRPKLINSINLAQASQWIAEADAAIDNCDLEQAADLLDRADETAGKMKMVVKRIEARRKRITERQAKAAKQATRKHRFRVATIATALAVGVAMIGFLGTWVFRSQEPEMSDTQSPALATEATETSKEDSLVELLSDFESQNPLVPKRFTNARWRAVTDGPASGSTCIVDSDDGATGTSSSLKWTYDITNTFAAVALWFSGSGGPVDLSAYDAISFYIKGASREGCAFKMQSAPRAGAETDSAALELDIPLDWQQVVIHLDAPPFLDQIDLARVYDIAFVDWEPDPTSNEVWIDQVMLHRRSASGAQTTRAAAQMPPTLVKVEHVEILSDFESQDALVPRLFTNATWRAEADDPRAMSTCDVDRSGGADGTGSCLRWSYQGQGTWAKLGLFLAGSWDASVDLSAYDAISFHIRSAGNRVCQFGLQSGPKTKAGIAEAEVPFELTPQWQKKMIHLDAPPFKEKIDFTQLYTLNFVDHDAGSFSNEIWIDQVMLHRRRSTGLEEDSAMPNEGTTPLVITADQVPMEVGDKWTFAISSPDLNLDGGRDFYSFYDKFEHNGETFFRRRAEIPGVIERTDGLQLLRHDGWFGFWEAGDDVPYEVTAKLPLAVGVEWEQDVLFRNKDGTKELRWNKGRAEAEETVDVPAGTFRCIRIRSYEFTPEEDDDRLVWFAPDVGMVKVVFGGGTTFELLSFVRSSSAPTGRPPAVGREAGTHDAVETIDKGKQLSSGLIDRPDVETGSPPASTEAESATGDDDDVEHYSPQDTSTRKAFWEGRFVGLGIEIETHVRGIRIKQVLPDYAADRAGLRTGEIIVEIDGKPTVGMSVRDAIEALGGPEGSDVRLLLSSPTREARTETITRLAMVVSGVESRLIADDVGLIEIRAFTQETKPQVRAALRKLAAQKVTGLILDLRSGGGGPLSKMTRVIDLFVASGQTLFYTQSSDGRRKEFKSRRNRVTNLPTVVLIDSASRGELMAAALQCTGRARLVGHKTPGVTADKQLIEHSDGSSDTVVRGQFLTCDQTLITGRGIEPDVEMPPNASPQEVMDKAIELLTGGP